jgi:hypothetical protein
MWQRIVQWWESKETRELLLVIITGLVVSQVRHGLEHHWKSWDTWEVFFAAWFINAFAVAVVTAVALAAITFTHKFFPRTRKNGYARHDLLYRHDGVRWRSLHLDLEYSDELVAIR